MAIHTKIQKSWINGASSSSDLGECMTSDGFSTPFSSSIMVELVAGEQ